jgi:hypothetical protein
MLATFILRLVPERATLGEVVGRIECVETGDAAACRGLADVVTFVRTHSGTRAASEDGEDA